MADSPETRKAQTAMPFSGLTLHYDVSGRFAYDGRRLVDADALPAAQDS